MDKAVERLNESAKKLDEMTDVANLKLTETLLQFDTMVQAQKEERVETTRMHNEAIEKIMERHAKDIAHLKHIIIGLIITICLIIGSLVGAAIYLVSNFEFEFQDGYELNQNIDIGGNGDPQIHDGIHFNAD